MHELRLLISRHPRLSVLVGINVAVWLVLRLLIVCSPSAGASVLHWCELPCGAGAMLHKPWSLITYMWVHTDGFHLLFNVLCLCWFGLMLPQGRGWSIGKLYVAGGLCGGILYAMVGAVAGNAIIGSSAAVIAVAVAVTMVVPKRRIQLVVIGPVPLVWITSALLVIDVASVMFGDYSGHVAHLGGALLGLVAGWRMRKWRFAPVLCGSFRSDAAEIEMNAERIIAKVRRSGHSSLTPEERRVLFKVSRGK